MSRLLFLIVMVLSVHVFALNTPLENNNQDIDVIEFTELEHRIIELSGLLSLSEQVKTSAQYMIAQSMVVAGNNAPENGREIVSINHAQHFGIAQSLSKRWAEAALENRLLVLIASIDKNQQKKIADDLFQQSIRSAQTIEKKAIRNQAEAEYLLYMNKLKQRPPAASRWQLVEELDRSSFFSALIIKTREHVYAEISRQVKGWQPPNNWKQDTKKEVLEFLFYAYRKTSNPELIRIAKSYQKPALNSFLVKVQGNL